MKTVCIAFVAISAIAAVSAEVKVVSSRPSSEEKKLSPEELAMRRQQWLVKTGGHVDRPAKGKIKIVNCQSLIIDDAIKTQQINLAKMLRVDVSVEKGTWKLGGALPSDASLAIYLVDDAELPPSLIAPEASWGVVNCNKLVEKNRFSKVFGRVAVALIGGCGNPQNPMLMKPARKLSDIDSIIGDNIPFEMAIKMIKNLEAYGIDQKRTTTYRKACKEGWAAAPTNDIQKAIWNEVHTLPTNPLPLVKPTK